MSTSTKGMVLASDIRFTRRETADRECERLTRGKTNASNALAVPVRPW